MGSMSGLFRHRHPFHLLLYLEWVLLGTAVLALFSPGLSPGWMPHRHHGWLLEQRPFYLGALTCLVTLGLMGLRLPMASPWSQGLYTCLGLGLSWGVVLLGGHGQTVFPPLLLIVVIRACILFPWSGRILVAALAYGSFLLMLLMAFLNMRPLGVALGRPLPPILRRIPAETLQGVLLGLTVNAALLFALVLGFVLLLVGAVVAEYHSRQQLLEANQRLRQYALLIENQATLQERNRIAREIHDSVGHSLVAQSIQLENVAMLLPSPPGAMVEHLQKARQLGREALQHVRQSVATLRIDPLRGVSLDRAIALLVQEFQKTQAIAVELQFAIITPLSAEMATALYRITQEALTNISKHSRASQVWLEFREQPTGITLKIEDNGQGFDPRQNTTGFGLQSMRERTQALTGTFHLQSQPGQGCRIQLWLPLPGGAR